MESGSIPNLAPVPMVGSTGTASSLRPVPPGGIKYTSVGAELDDSLYDLSKDELQFLMQETGINDPEELKKHIVSVQHEVYAVHPYPCIRIFHFVKLKTCRYRIYPEVLQLANTRPGALYLDVGCCVGNDLRKLVADGWPATQVVGSDLHADFWKTGHKVFKSTPESFPAKFIPGDIFDKSFLDPASVATKIPEGSSDLSSVTTLTPLRGRFSAIHTSAFFHLFNEEQQTELAYLLASLLSPEPGSVIFGGHVGRPEKGLIPEPLVRANTFGSRTFCHSSESFVALWEEVFGPGKVEAVATLTAIGDVRGVNKGVERWKTGIQADVGEDLRQYWLAWSVKRL